MQNPSDNAQKTSESPLSGALIIIGNEILSGRTQDTNTQWIAEHLTRRGIKLLEVRVVPDIESRVIEAVNALRAQYTYVFTTGGIGPTHDDITAECIAKAFGLPYEMHAGAYALLEAHYGKADLTPARAKMAMMPGGADLIPNPVSGAPGFIVENVYTMAGVPRIMQAMFDHVLDSLGVGAQIFSNTVGCSLSESMVAEGLKALQARFAMIEIGSYPHFRAGNTGTSLVLRGTDREAIRAATGEVITLIETLDGTASLIGLQVPREEDDTP